MAPQGRLSVDGWQRGRCRSIAGWLAIVALLLNGLLPAGFSLAPAAAGPVIGFCGSPPAPGQQQLPPGGSHCIYCLVVPVAPAPGPMPALAVPRFVGFVIVPESRRRLVDRARLFAAAQPRGPPPPPEAPQRDR